MNRLADYHLHTSLCNHAHGTMKEYVKTAIKNNLGEIGFADHAPIKTGAGERFRMRPRDLQIYFETIQILQKQYKTLKIKTGIELDFIVEKIDILKKFSQNTNFDYVIGSVHYMQLPNQKKQAYLSEIKAESVTTLYELYFNLIEKLARSGIFDIIAHFDLPIKFWGGFGNKEFKMAKRTLESIKKAGVCLEVNTSGFRTKGVLAPYPGKRLLNYACQLGIPVTLGSDSHHPNDVGSHFKEALQILIETGFKSISVFENRKRKSIPITC